MNSETLNQEFAIDGNVSFVDINDDSVAVDINNSQCQARIIMQGAHLVHWQPVDCAQPVIWLSEDARFARGKSIRGGVPVCWPWFGPHVTDKKLPAHGYARTVDWELMSTKQVDEGNTELQFRLIENDQSRAMWPHDSECRLHFVIGKTLQLTLSTENRDSQALVLSEALHTYFAIGDIEQVQVSGLDACDYYDKVSDSMQRQQGAIQFSQETDRVYMNTDARCVIEDQTWQRRIVIKKSASQSTVVWNPWVDKANAMGDLGPEGWRHMLCVESANALDNQLSLQPGETHNLVVEYSVE